LGGQKSLAETITQLRGRLTWCDSYGVAIMLSKNVGFSEALNAISDGIPKVAGFVERTLQRRDAHHFVARFSIPSDESRQAEINVLAYNLYVQEPGKRQTKTHVGLSPSSPYMVKRDL
jgi:hypothetical protein